MNKWLAFILLLLITAGTFIPCCSADDCCAEQQLANSSNPQKHTDEGTCSPFFACTTCPGFVAMATPFQLAEPFKELTIHHQSRLVIQLPNYSSSFWQPPRSC